MTSLVSLHCDVIDVILNERSKRPGAVSEVLSRPVRYKSTMRRKKQQKKIQLVRVKNLKFMVFRAFSLF